MRLLAVILGLAVPLTELAGKYWHRTADSGDLQRLLIELDQVTVHVGTVTLPGHVMDDDVATLPGSRLERLAADRARLTRQLDVVARMERRLHELRLGFERYARTAIDADALRIVREKLVRLARLEMHQASIKDRCGDILREIDDDIAVASLRR